MRRPDLPVIGYLSTSPATDSTVKPWVGCTLIVVQFLGVLGGRMLWPNFWVGKDPEVEFAWANGAGFMLFAVLCFAFQGRLTRFCASDAAFAFSLGFLSSVVGIGWGLHDGYGR